MAKWKLLAKRALRSVGFPMHKLPLVRPPMLDYYELDSPLKDIYATISGRTVVDRERVMMLRQFARATLPLPGDVAEVGVYKGGTARLLAETLRGSGKSLLLFDTFSGMPQTSAGKDVHQAGDFGDTSLEQVTRFLGGCERVEFFPGLFPQTAQGLCERTFCMVHADVDIYSSTRACCEFFYPRLVGGGILVFDDYGYLSCPGVKSAADEFFAGKPETPVFLPTGQAFVVKHGSSRA
ncbi:MAG: class I SAM-dependent methyltransferase [bacterium]|nr:class I SAM-dependent methyltransferase [bacterium]